VGRITHQIPPLLHRQHHVEPRALYVVSAGDLHYEFGVEESVRAVRLARSVRRSFMFVHRATTISLAAQHNIPAVYSEPVWVQDGGLLSYGPYADDIFRRAATYWIASCVARRRRTCQFSFRSNSRWLSTSKPPRRSALLCRNRYSCAPTK
jgi:hypothetical protein